MNQLVGVKKYNTKQFVWTGAEMAFSAKRSDLGVVNGDMVFGPVRGNHSGIILVSERTGEEKEFSIVHVEFDKDNKILWWNLRMDGTDQSNSRLLRVIIYNE